LDTLRPAGGSAPVAGRRLEWASGGCTLCVVAARLKHDVADFRSIVTTVTNIRT
jgi:hypothetical protein